MASNIERAKAIIDARRENAELSAERKRFELETISPELKEINYKISRAGLDVLKAIGNGAQGINYVEQLVKQNLEFQAKRKEILKGLGLSVDALDVHYTCSVCEDTGIKDGHYCECFKALVKQFQYENLCSCAPAKDSTFENFRLDYYTDEAHDRMEQIYNYCKTWADDFDRNANSILMYGETGLGKTHLSLAIANDVVKKGYTVLYTSASNIFNKLEKESFGRLKSDESPEEAVLNCDLLILDDLGAEFTKQYVVAELYNIVNTRILSGLPTIISTNLFYEEIGDRYNPRVYSRLIGNYQMLEFIGSDIRQLKD